jgi:hypothetical protein
VSRTTRPDAGRDHPAVGGCPTRWWVARFVKVGVRCVQVNAKSGAALWAGVVARPDASTARARTTPPTSPWTTIFHRLAFKLAGNQSAKACAHGARENPKPVYAAQ